MTSRMKILHCLGTLNPGGVETWLVNLLRHLDSSEYQFDFCVLGNDEGCYADEVRRMGCTVHRCPRHPSSRLGGRFRQILRQGHYDVVHSHVHFFSGALLRWAALEDVPIRVAHSHTSQDKGPGSLVRKAYRRWMAGWMDRYTTHGVAVSSWASVGLFGATWQMDPRIRVLHYGIDLQPFRELLLKNKISKDNGIPADAPVVVHVGNFVPAKNHGFFLQITEQVVARRPDIHFVLIGDGPLRPEIEIQARQMKLERNVHFLGTRRDVAMLLHRCNAFLFPSRWEGLPCAVLEAQAAGLPCVISQEISEEVVVLPQQVTRLPLSDSAAQWAAHTVEMLDRGKCDLGESLRIFEMSEFTVEQSLHSLLEIYSGKRVEARAVAK